MDDITASVDYDAHRKECEEIFMKTSNYYKSIVSGVIILIGILGGSVVFAISSTSQSSKQEVQLQNIDKRVETIENKFDDIDGKLDKIYDEVKLQNAE